jgi:purine-binding chemotaxis protein CheW
MMEGDDMDSVSLLIFELDGARFGVDATRVRESFWLPELTPAEEALPWVVGLFNLRGRIIPIVDLRLRFEHPPQRYSPDDQIVVLEEADSLPMGLIVNIVVKVIDLPRDAIQPPPQFDAMAPGPAHLVAGEARVGDDLVTVLDVARLTHMLQALPPQPSPGGGEGVEAPSLAPGAGDGRSGGHIFLEATPAERALLRTRAVTLREAVVEEEGARLGLAVVELGGEYFGVELAAVQEFCDIAQVRPIPCCPPHILGAMNLRGDLLTLIDPRAALKLPAASRGGKAVVARLGGQAVAIAVDEVRNVVYLRRNELQAPPAGLREQCGAEFMGTAPYAGRIMTALDLPALLAREEWIVNQTV